MTEEQILEKIREILSNSFEIEPEQVSLEKTLYEDLDLDSIDAVDLVIQLQELTGKRIKPEVFKNVRTVEDVITAVKALISSTD